MPVQYNLHLTCVAILLAAENAMAVQTGAGYLKFVSANSSVCSTPCAAAGYNIAWDKYGESLRGLSLPVSQETSSDFVDCLHLILLIAGNFVWMSASQDSMLNCSSIIALSSESSIPPPGSGNMIAYDYRNPTMYPSSDSDTAVDTAAYTSESFVLSQGNCKLTYGFTSTKKNVANASGLMGMNTAKMIGPTSTCSCNSAYWYVWTAIGDVAWVPMSTSQTDSEICFTSLYRVTEGSLLHGGKMTRFYFTYNRIYMVSAYEREDLRDNLTYSLNAPLIWRKAPSSNSESSSDTCTANYTELMDPAPSPNSAPNNIPGPSSSTAARSSTPAPSATITNYQVKLTLLFQMSVASFNANTSLQQSLKEQMAVTVGLNRADATRVQLAARAARRRQLLADTAVIDVTINMPDVASANKAVTLLTSAAIASALSSAGLPPATVTSPASSSSPATGAASTLSPSGCMISSCMAMIAALAAASAALGA
jgi:hypothetical protein